MLFLEVWGVIFLDWGTLRIADSCALAALLLHPLSSTVCCNVTLPNSAILLKLYYLQECRKTKAAFIVEMVLNWHSRNSAVGGHTCLAASTICIATVHHIAQSPTVFPWSAIKLILLFTLHLYQHDSDFSDQHCLHGYNWARSLVTGTAVVWLFPIHPKAARAADRAREDDCIDGWLELPGGGMEIKLPLPV